MEQKTEASQAVERRAEYEAFCEWVRETPSKPFSDMAWEAWKDGRARLRAALKAQPAPTEATEKPFGYFIVEGDDLPYPGSGFIRELDEGRVYRSVTPVYTRPAPTEAAQGAQLSGNSGELQPSGNTGEAAQGEYSFSKPKGWINLANPGQSWEQWTKAQGIPTTRGWKISAQGEDSARLDFIEKHAIKGGTYKGITSANVILHEGEWHELGLRAAIDAARARASAETGGVKP